MGSAFITDCIEGTDPAKCYRDLRSGALASEGHDPYNGTISTSNGYFVWDDTTPRTRFQAEEFINSSEVVESDRLRKWESFGAIPYCRGGERITKQFKTRVEGDYFGPGRKHLAVGLVSHHPAPKGTHAVSATMLDDAVRKVKVSSTKGAGDTSGYIVSKSGGFNLNKTWGPFGSLAFAKSEAKRILDDRPSMGPLEIFYRRSAIDGTGLWTLDSSVTTTGTVEVVYEADAKYGDLVEGWIFFGWAAM